MKKRLLSVLRAISFITIVPGTLIIGGLLSPIWLIIWIITGWSYFVWWNETIVPLTESDEERALNAFYEELIEFSKSIDDALNEEKENH